MGFDLGNLLQQYLGGAADPARAEQDFPQAAQAAPPGAVAQGVTEAFRSDQTPPFAQMVSQLFGRSDGQQRAGMLNQLLAHVNPAMLSALAGTVGNLFGQNGQPQVTPEQAQNITPQQVEEIAHTAEQHNPGIVDHIGAFYGEHPQLVQALGGAALAIVLGKIAQSHRG
jgi:hypothetical protein